MENSRFKFRAYCEATKMIYQITDIDFSNCVANGVCCRDWQEFSTSKLLQYTGLKDKNGVEIYEGDIISVDWDKNASHGLGGDNWIGSVFFNSGSFDIDSEWCVSLNTINGIIEVIGNIYQHKELLENEKS